MLGSTLDADMVSFGSGLSVETVSASSFLDRRISKNQRIIADANKIIRIFDASDVQILNGRWGAYITDGIKNAKIPADLRENPGDITLDQAEKLLAEAPDKKFRSKKKVAAKKTAAKKTTARKKSSSKKKSAAKKKAVSKKASGKKVSAKKTAAKTVSSSKQ